MATTLENLKWRAAIKNFDHTKKLTEQQLDELLTAVQLSPSSAGLQPYRIVVVEDAETRKKLREAGYNQAQITDASHLVVFAAEKEVNNNLVKKYIDLIAATRQVDREQLAGFEQAILGSINSKTTDALPGRKNKPILQWVYFRQRLLICRLTPVLWKVLTRPRLMKFWAWMKKA